MNFRCLIWTMNKRTFLKKDESSSKRRKLKGSKQHRTKKLKETNIREAEMKMITGISKFMKLKLENSTPRSVGKLSADKVLGKMFVAEIKQFIDNVKPFAKDEIDSVLFRYRMHINQSTVQQFTSPPITPSPSFTPKHFSTPTICKMRDPQEVLNLISQEVGLII